MKFKRALWFPIAIGLSIINAIALVIAARAGEPMHVMGHVAAGIGLGFWAVHLRRARRDGDASLAERVEDQAAALAEVQDVLADQAAQLAELQERLDFTERMLAQVRDRPSLGIREERP
jgi:hypothetical protein